MTEKATSTLSARDKIRGQIFTKKVFETKELKMFGATIEVRQPTLGMILSAQEEENRQLSVMKLLIGYCFVPGTDERIFEDADLDTVMGLPFDKDMEALNKVIMDMTGIDIAGAEKNSEEASSDTTS